MLRTHATRLAALAVVMVLGCAGAPPSTDVYPAGATSDGGPRMGGRAILVREEDPDFLDPALSYGVFSAPVNQAIFQTLLEYADAPGAAGAVLEPNLAETLPDIREGGTLFAFKVRADARFSAPIRRHITAADFKYSIERLFKVNSPSVPFYASIVGARDVLAGRDSTLRGLTARGDSLYIRIERPDPVFLQILSMAFSAPVPREVADLHPNDFSQHTVASGPYMVAEFVPRRRVLLVRNPDYCGAPGYLDTIEIKLGVSVSNAVAMIKRGLADGGFFNVPSAEIGRLRADPEWREQLDAADGLNTNFVFMNTRVPPFNDVRVRQAVCWALDRRAFVKVYAGLAMPAYEFLPVGMPGVEPLHMYQGPDLDKARALLAEAGFPRGFKTKLYSYGTEPIPRILAIIQQQLAGAGIEVELDIGEAAGYTSMAGDTTNRIPFGFYAWTADYIDASNFLDVLLNGRRITPKHNLNLAMFANPGIDARMERAMTTLDDSLRIAMWNDVDRAVMEEAPIAVLYHVLECRLYHPRLAGWYRHITRILRLEKLYLKQPLATPATTAAAGAGS